MSRLLFRAPLVLPALALVAAIAGCAGPSALPSADTAAAVPDATAVPDAAVAPEHSATPESRIDAGESTIVLSVSGTASQALIRDAVILGDRGDPNRGTTVRTLPWSAETTLSAEQAAGFVKVVLFAKNVDGARDELNCTVTIDGEVATRESAASPRPITCLVVRDPRG